MENLFSKLAHLSLFKKPKGEYIKVEPKEQAEEESILEESVIDEPVSDEKICTLNIEDIMSGRYLISSYGKIIDTENNNEEVNIDYRTRIGRVFLTSKSGRCKEYSLNRLLAFTFLPKTDKDILFNRNLIHVKDWNSKNHNINNLEWRNSTEMYILVNFDKKGKKDREDEIVYIQSLVRRNYDFDDILEVIPFTTPMHDIVAIYRDMKI